MMVLIVTDKPMPAALAAGAGANNGVSLRAPSSIRHHA
jgi:hypothetical protein